MFYILITIFFNVWMFTTCFGQTNTTGTQIDPYSNGYLSKYYDSTKIDFSKEYYQLQTNYFRNDTDRLNQLLKYDCSTIWLTKNDQQNGVIGANNQRIQIHTDNVAKSKTHQDIYFITGKSKVNNNICTFSGEIKLLKLFFSLCEDTEKVRCGTLFGSYIFYEDSTNEHSGVFKGIMDCAVYIDSVASQILLDQSSIVADGYYNRSFVGTWTEYKSKRSKKCIWGDYRLPFTFDFDGGDGEMSPREKYKINGWQYFNDGSEMIRTSDSTYELKAKWWLRK